MTLDTIAKAIRNAILNDANLSATCLALFGKPHKVFYGAEGSRSPAIEDCPCFSIHPAGKSVGHGAASKNFSVRIGIDILQSDPEAGASDLEFSGPANLEVLSDRALALVVGLSSNISVEVAELEVGTVNEFPILSGELTLSIAVANVIGAELTL
jgi:hypothetical protein